MTHPTAPSELLDSVVAYIQPRRIILFGPQARGDAGPDSDIDLRTITLSPGQANRAFDTLAPKRLTDPKGNDDGWGLKMFA